MAKSNHVIEDIIVTSDHIDSQVTYLPPGIDNVHNKKCEHGIISSFNEHTLWVRYKSATGEATDPSRLRWVNKPKE